jgi:hypothetical protein
MFLVWDVGKGGQEVCCAILTTAGLGALVLLTLSGRKRKRGNEIVVLSSMANGWFVGLSSWRPEIQSRLMREVESWKGVSFAGFGIGTHHFFPCRSRRMKEEDIETTKTSSTTLPTKKECCLILVLSSADKET